MLWPQVAQMWLATGLAHLVASLVVDGAVVINGQPQDWLELIGNTQHYYL